MAYAFRQHGAETVQLLDPTRRFICPKGATYQVISLLRSGFSSLDSDRNSVICPRSFFASTTERRGRYVAQLLDGTFTYYALTTDKATSQFLHESIRSLSLFLDTNFIFSVLDLHTNPFDNSSREVIEAIEQQDSPFKLYFHVATLKELQNTIEYYGSRLKYGNLGSDS